MRAKLRPNLTYPHVVSTLALVVAVAAAVWAISSDGDEGTGSEPVAGAQVPPVQGEGVFAAANPDVSNVNTDGITQVTGTPLGPADGGTYLVTGAVRVNDADGSAGEDSVIDCRLVRNPGTAFVDGRSVRLIDTGILEVPQQATIAMNGVTELTEGQQIDMMCAQELETGNLEATVDSARLTYTRVSP